jgi:tetratricopeptide (TPR) repeat protein
LNLHRQIVGQILLGATFLIWMLGSLSLFGQSSGRGTNDIRIVALENIVEVSPKGATTWVRTQTNQVLHPMDRLRTGPDSRVTLQWPGESAVPFGPSTELLILPPNTPDAEPGLHLVRGILSFFHRDKPGRIQVITRGAVAGIEGTEFVLKVDDADNTTIYVIDGRVRFTNDQATLVLTNGQQAVAALGKAPVPTVGFIANNVLQWCFYYPAVVDLAELPLSEEEQNALADSLAAYRKGDLLAALVKYPAGRPPASDAERVYYAAVVLSVGEVAKAEATLASLSSTDPSSRPQRLAAALRELIAAVKRQTISTPTSELASEYLASSYYQQSLAKRDVSLRLALNDARQAAAKSPQFGFAWARVAELEFSFGRTRAAAEALKKSLELAPRNAQALALRGFLLAAENNPREGLAWFDKALEVDSGLGNAWLGRGLCRIHLGDFKGGREDLLIAAAVEPQRAELRNYLGKAFGDDGEFPRAMKEFGRAQTLDPHDPTAWLYSALLRKDYNQINEAIRDLEKSKELNDNRSVYRSGLLLDQDQAVRSANLAGIYSDAGMDEVAQWEAARAVNYDYANYSAHLFLANSYAQMTDPNFVNLRFETPTEAEFLIANLLAPVSAGPLSAGISQQEYSPLFVQNRAGLFSSTEYLSRGAWTQLGGQYGIFDNFNYDLEGFYHGDPGQRPNDDIAAQSISLHLKAQFTPHDSAYFLMQYAKEGGGDLTELYNQNLATNSTARFDERQEPILGLGYNHEWAPGVHTLVFGARLADKFILTNQAQQSLVFFDHPNPTNPPSQVLTSVQGDAFNELYENELEIYSGEVQQILEVPDHTTIVGARAQYGHFNTSNLQDNPLSLGPVFPLPPAPAADQDVKSLFKRFSVYGYHEWELVDWLELIGGITYDRLTFPENFRLAPISAVEKTEDQVSPKAGMILHPLAGTTVRFAFTRSLAGASVDQSYQIEPTQVAGFIQTFRSVIPESVVGANAGAKFETYNLSLEQRFCTGTYLGLSGQILNSEIDRVDGAFDSNPMFPSAVPSGLKEHLDYTEETVGVTANQLIGNEWALGGSYNLSRATLNDVFPTITGPIIVGSPPFSPRQHNEGILNNLDLFAIYNDPRGFFAEGEALWYHQHNIGYGGMEPGDDFWQFNVFGGYRFPRRRAQVTLGVLNLAGRNYHLNPLNLYNELPRERTLAVQFSVNF